MKQSPRKGAIMYGIVKNMTPPCYICENHSVGCHGKCEKYKEYRTALDEKKAIASKQIADEMLIDGFVSNNVRRAVRRKGLKVK